MKNRKLTHILALVLAAVMLFSTPAAGAERVDIVLSSGSETMTLQAGLDESGLPGLEMRLGGETIAISREGLRIDSAGQSIGIAPDALSEAFWTEVLGVQALPSLTEAESALKSAQKSPSPKAGEGLNAARAAGFVGAPGAERARPRKRQGK